MWPINYENIHKLHMSLGIGLLVASFIVFFSAHLNFYEKTTAVDTTFDIDEDYPLENVKEIVNEKLQLIQNQLDYVKGLTLQLIFYARVMFYLGSALFFVGYFPFLTNHIKTRIKNKKMQK